MPRHGHARRRQGGTPVAYKHSGPTCRLRKRPCVIGSVKSNVGHLLTAAAAAGLAKVLLALEAETLPPTANFETPDG